jgi:beta-lactamase regulating signal transducer with metallopeptidase domain
MMWTFDSIQMIARHWFDSIAAQSLYAAVAAVAVFAVLKLWRPRHPVWAVALWSLVLIRFVMPVDVAAPWTARSVAERGSQTWLMRDYAAIQKRQRPLMAQEITVRASAGSGGAVAHAAVRPAPPPADWRTAALALWALGASLLLTRLALAWQKLKTILSRATAVVPEPLTLATDMWRVRLGVRRPVRLLVSPDSHGAFTTGVVTPVIVLPHAMVTRMEAADLNAIIGHEMAHIRGLDSVWLAGEQVLRALFFFHPAIWFATAKLDEAREALRDLDMLEAGPVSANAYAVTLLSVLKNQRDAAVPPVLAVAMGRTAERLKQRLLLLKGSQMLKSPSRWLIGGATVAIAALILPMAHSDAKSGAKKPAAAVSRPSAPRPVRATASGEGFAVFTADAHGQPDPAGKNTAVFVSPPAAPPPPAPPEPAASWLQEDRQDALDAVAESERDAQQAVIEAEQAVKEAQREAATASADSRQALAEAQRDAERARGDAARAAQAASEARRNLMTESPGSLDSMVVIDGAQIRCGALVRPGREHQIVVNDKTVACTGALTQADVEGKTRHTAGAVAILGKRGVLRVNRNGKDVYVYSDTGAHQRVERSGGDTGSIDDAREKMADARAESLASLAEAAASLREQRSTLKQNLQHAGLPQAQIAQILGSVEKSLADIEQQRAALSRTVAR